MANSPAPSNPLAHVEAERYVRDWAKRNNFLDRLPPYSQMKEIYEDIQEVWEFARHPHSLEPQHEWECNVGDSYVPVCVELMKNSGEYSPRGSLVCVSCDRGCPLDERWVCIFMYCGIRLVYHRTWKGVILDTDEECYGDIDDEEGENWRAIRPFTTSQPNRMLEDVIRCYLIKEASTTVWESYAWLLGERVLQTN